ncbi:hypothetical protein ID866_4577, partial [Astraeus odoratus]
GDEYDDVVQKPVVEEPFRKDTVQKKEREALWAAFQASVATPTSPKEQLPVQLVKVEKRYLFAGKHVTDVVEVPADSEDAKKWPLWRPPEQQSLQLEQAQIGTLEQQAESLPPALDTISTAPAAARRLGPRRPRTTLPSLPTPGSSKAKKITTLDKSAMDWRAHVTSQGTEVQDELIVNRRGGGYLEKVDFLQRVEDRRQDVLEASKSNKRRKL